VDSYSLRRLLDQVELAAELAKAYGESEEIVADKMRHAAKCSIVNGHIPRETFAYAEMFMQASDPAACLQGARRLFEPNPFYAGIV
jgi:hypothetical protein